MSTRDCDSEPDFSEMSDEEAEKHMLTIKALLKRKIHELTGTPSVKKVRPNAVSNNSYNSFI